MVSSIPPASDATSYDDRFGRRQSRKRVLESIETLVRQQLSRDCHYCAFTPTAFRWTDGRELIQVHRLRQDRDARSWATEFDHVRDVLRARHHHPRGATCEQPFEPRAGDRTDATILAPVHDPTGFHPVALRSIRSTAVNGDVDASRRQRPRQRHQSVVRRWSLALRNVCSDESNFPPHSSRD
jgi:hypothetical protein